MVKPTNVQVGEFVEVQTRGKYSRTNPKNSYQTYRGIYRGTKTDGKDGKEYVVLTEVYQNNWKGERQKSDCSKHSIRSDSIFTMVKVDRLW